ncbi:MAG: hypothetical protein SNH88_06215, partial [Rikenellaceae bacterium]
MRLITITAAIIGTIGITNGQPIGIAYYDVDQLYDTIQSPFYDDREFTPNGRNGWSERRYRDKITKIAAVIDSMQMPIVALYGVENQDVVRDVVRQSALDYSYSHRTLNSYDGLDFSLLYFGDMFYPRHIYSSFGWLYIELKALREEWSLGIYLVRHGYNLRSASPPHADKPPNHTIAMGRIDRDDLKRLELIDLLQKRQRQGYGNMKYDRLWQFHDLIGVGSGTKVEREGVFITKWLLTKDGSRPLATISGRDYIGGYSRYLPIYLYINT